MCLALHMTQWYSCKGKPNQSGFFEMLLVCIQFKCASLNASFLFIFAMFFNLVFCLLVYLFCLTNSEFYLVYLALLKGHSQLTYRILFAYRYCIDLYVYIFFLYLLVSAVCFAALCLVLVFLHTFNLKCGLVRVG